MSLRIIGAVLKSRGDHLAGRVRGAFQSKTTRVDGNLPLGIAIGGMVGFDETPFLLADGISAVTWPGARLLVQAYGRYDFHGHQGHRFYLGDGSSFLQIMTDRGGQVVPGEVRLFQHFDEVNPPTTGDWDFWLADGDGSIGLDRFQTRDGILYDRTWNPGAPWVRPAGFAEILYPDPAGTGSKTARHQAMLYQRHASADLTEYMLLSAVQEGRSAWVELAVGMTVDTGFLEIL